MPATYHRRLSRSRALISVARARVAPPPIVAEVRRRELTLLREDALTDLWEAAREVEARGVPGSFVEAGTARGGSAIVLADAKDPTRALDVHDTFGLIPPPSERDGPDVHARYEVIASGGAEGRGSLGYYGYENDLRGQVEQSFSDCGLACDANAVTLHQGLFDDTLRPGSPVAFAHLDGDWYDSVMVCLERLSPWLSPGGVMVIDDYEAWSGCQRAVDDFLARSDQRFDVRWRSRLQLRRLS